MVELTSIGYSHMMHDTMLVHAFVDIGLHIAGCYKGSLTKYLGLCYNFDYKSCIFLNKSAYDYSFQNQYKLPKQTKLINQSDQSYQNNQT